MGAEEDTVLSWWDMENCLISLTEKLRNKIHHAKKHGMFLKCGISFSESSHSCKPHIKMSFLHLAMHTSIPKLISLGIYDDSLSHRETKKVESPLNNLSHKFWNMCAPLHHLLNTHLPPGYKSKKLHLSKWASPSNVFVFLNFGLVIYLEHKWTRAILHRLFYL